jgi:UDP-N-acetylglucosamine--N-acetylmuramyl-(pentapeptide) pyrophosphoryl-undecaprenol N-acetylglucosamine transferase
VGEPVTLPEPALRYAGRSGPLQVLVVGGSLGAQALNSTVPQALALLAPQARPAVVHQSGKAHTQALADAYRAAGVQARLVDFIDDMAAEYARADLVICRAGAMTVSEVAAAGVASLMVPFPFAVDDHQTTNAKFLADRGAALLGVFQELTRATLADMAGRARALAKPDATRRVADVCEEIAR